MRLRSNFQSHADHRRNASGSKHCASGCLCCRKRASAVLVQEEEEENETLVNEDDERIIPRRATYCGSEYVLLNPEGPEYKAIEKQLRPRQIIKVEKIICTEVRAKFEEERERLRVRRRRELEQGTAKECLQLFHGTTAQAAQSIVEQGFKKELAGKRGSLYGKGVYFAVKAEMALGYADINLGTGNQTLLLCDVLIGMFTKRLKDSVMPPPIPGYSHLLGSDEYLYYSTVNNDTNPTIYVSCYKGNHYAFPKFIVTVKAQYNAIN